METNEYGYRTLSNDGLLPDKMAKVRAHKVPPPVIDTDTMNLIKMMLAEHRRDLTQRREVRKEIKDLHEIDMQQREAIKDKIDILRRKERALSKEVDKLSFDKIASKVDLKRSKIVSIDRKLYSDKPSKS